MTSYPVKDLSVRELIAILKKVEDQDSFLVVPWGCGWIYQLASVREKPLHHTVELVLEEHPGAY